jgi:hypothetical protein
VRVAGLDEVVPPAQAEAERSRRRLVSLLQRLQKRYPVGLDRQSG